MSGCPTHLCFAPEVNCALGHVDLGDCAAWAGRAGTSAGAEPVGEDGLLPWSGGALGLADLSFLTACSRPTVVGVVGPQGAGKTTLLAAWYLLVGKGALARPERSFAGSFTLSGWEAIAGSLRWAPGQPPTFPPHTTSRGGRSPGLLHLAFRDVGARRRRDVLFTDAPGEWFRDWAVDRDSLGAAGARWVAEHADVILFVADREALAGEGMGVARSAIQLLASRVAAERRGRPVALSGPSPTWKSDPRSRRRSGAPSSTSSPTRRSSTPAWSPPTPRRDPRNAASSTCSNGCCAGGRRGRRCPSGPRRARTRCSSCGRARERRGFDAAPWRERRRQDAFRRPAPRQADEG